MLFFCETCGFVFAEPRFVFFLGAPSFIFLGSIFFEGGFPAGRFLSAGRQRQGARTGLRSEAEKARSGSTDGLAAYAVSAHAVLAAFDYFASVR